MVRGRRWSVGCGLHTYEVCGIPSSLALGVGAFSALWPGRGRLSRFVSLSPRAIFLRVRWYADVETTPLQPLPWRVCGRLDGVHLETFESPSDMAMRVWCGTGAYTGVL